MFVNIERFLFFITKCKKMLIIIAKTIDKIFHILYNIVKRKNNSAIKKIFKAFLILIVVALCGNIVVVETK